MNVYTNSGPLVALSKQGRLHLLSELFDRVGLYRQQSIAKWSLRDGARAILMLSLLERLSERDGCSLLMSLTASCHTNSIRCLWTKERSRRSTLRHVRLQSTATIAP